MSAPLVSSGDLVRVVESRHPSLRGRQVTVQGIIVRGVVEHADGSQGEMQETVQSVAAVGAPKFTVGEPVTPEMGEPPVGSEVRFRATSGYFWRQRSWLALDGNHDMIEAHPPETWENLRIKGAKTRQEIILVSLPDQLSEPSVPTPEMREVPLSEAREGDWITLKTKVVGLDPLGLKVSVGGLAYYFRDRPSPELTVTRATAPLPTRPGTVGVATVRGVKDVRVMLSTDGEKSFWMSTVCIGGLNAHEPQHITDFVELLPGEDQ